MPIAAAVLLGQALIHNAPAELLSIALLVATANVVVLLTLTCDDHQEGDDHGEL